MNKRTVEALPPWRRKADKNRLLLTGLVLGLLAAEAAASVTLVVLRTTSIGDGLAFYAGLSAGPTSLLAIAFHYYFRRPAT